METNTGSSPLGHTHDSVSPSGSSTASPGPDVIGVELAVRTYTTGDCDTIKSLVPLVKDSNIKILPTLDLSPDEQFQGEKQALMDAIGLHGCSWIAGAAIVGSNDLSLDMTDDDLESEATFVADRIGEVKEALSGPCQGQILMTHAEIADRWQDDAAATIMDMVDVIGLNALSLSSSTDIADAPYYLRTFFSELKDVAPGKEIWITETGWPSNKASVQEEAAWWRKVNCGPDASLKDYKRLWNEAFDNLAWTESSRDYLQHYSVASSDRVLKFDLTC